MANNNKTSWKETLVAVVAFILVAILLNAFGCFGSSGSSKSSSGYAPGTKEYDTAMYLGRKGYFD